MAEVSKSNIWDEIDLSERTSEIFTELKLLFGSVEAIPIEVFQTGACMQISEGITSNLSAIFEEFLIKWKYVENDRYIFSEEDHFSKFPWQSAPHSEKYLEVVEVFTMIFLVRVLCKPELAISWIEKLDLPEDKRQDILRRLNSVHLASDSSSSISPATFQTAERVNESPGTEILSKSANSSNQRGERGSKLAPPKPIDPPIKYLTRRSSPFWWFSTAQVKFGGIHLVLPRGRVVLVVLIMAFTSYFLRRKGSELRKFPSRLAMSLRRALIDAWQLAFSVQVNPLAAVQQVSSAPRSSM